MLCYQGNLILIFNKRNGRFVFYISTNDEIHYSEENDMLFMDHRPSDKMITHIVVKTITLTGHSIPF